MTPGDFLLDSLWNHLPVDQTRSRRPEVLRLSNSLGSCANSFLAFFLQPRWPYWAMAVPPKPRPGLTTDTARQTAAFR